MAKSAHGAKKSGKTWATALRPPAKAAIRACIAWQRTISTENDHHHRYRTGAITGDERAGSCNISRHDRGGSGWRQSMPVANVAALASLKFGFYADVRLARGALNCCDRVGL